MLVGPPGNRTQCEASLARCSDTPAPTLVADRDRLCEVPVPANGCSLTRLHGLGLR